MSGSGLTVQQNGTSLLTQEYLNGLVQGTSLATDLREFIGNSGMQVSVCGKSTPGDGGGGVFYWSDTSTAPDDGATAIRPNGALTGRWLLLPRTGLTTILNIAALRGFSGPAPAAMLVQGYYAAGDSGGGIFESVPSDTTSSDNSGTIIVDALGRRWYRSTMGETASVSWFGATGTNTATDTAAFSAALNSMKSGGTVTVQGGKTYTLNSFTVPAGVTLLGPYAHVGAPGASNYSPPYNSLSSLRLTSGATITLSGSGTIDGFFIAPSGMVFQQTTDGAFAGTAVTVAGDDIMLRNCLIMGFAQALTSTTFNRLRIQNNNFDNIANIYINGSYDTCYISDNHMWPFATVQQGGLGVNLQRSGSAIKMENCVDDTKIVSCISFGYFVGFELVSCDSVQLIGCAADGASYGYGIGFSITSGSTDTVLIGCQGSGNAIGCYIKTTGALNIQTSMTGCFSWGNQSHGVLVDAGTTGDVSILGGGIHDCPNGISIASAVSRVDVEAVRFEAITAPSAISLTVVSSNVRVGPMVNLGQNGGGTTGTAIGPNSVCQTIVGAAAIGLPLQGDTFIVAGSASIGTINGGWNGRRVTLLFGASSSVLSSTGAITAIRCANNATQTFSVGGSITLVHNGVQWYQTGAAA